MSNDKVYNGTNLGYLKKRRSADDSKDILYLHVNKDVSILVNGVPLDLGKFRTINLNEADKLKAFLTSKADQNLEAGEIDSDRYDQEIAKTEKIARVITHYPPE